MSITTDLSILRTHIATAFDDVQLDAFCLDNFPVVYEKFSRGLYKDEKLTLLLDYCRRTPGELVRLSSFLPEPKPLHSHPYHNLPQADYIAFVGREKELAWLRNHLLSTSQAWQIAVTGIGGVGKSALTLSLAQEYCNNYEKLPSQERFEAIIWISAKEEILTTLGREPAGLPSIILHTLEDIYTVIARTLEREDITRALPENQSWLVEKALKQQRALLIIDNLESFKDERIRPFLRQLPTPTKTIITSRQWIDVVSVLPLRGLSWKEAKQLITQEAAERDIKLNAGQSKHIFELTSGLPLPIRLAIGRLSGGESFYMVTDWLSDAIGELPEYCIKGQIAMVQQHNVNAWRVLLTCSLFERIAGASREALGFVSELSIQDLDQALALLQRLFLINHTSNNRFWVLPIVQRYVNAHFTNSEVETKLVKRWLEWLAKFAQDKGIDLEMHAFDLKDVGQEYNNLLNGLRWSRKQNMHDTVFQIAQGTWDYAYMTGLFEDAWEIIDVVKEISGDSDDILCWALNRYARIYNDRGLYSISIEFSNQAENIAVDHNDLELLRAWTNRAFALLLMGRTDESEKIANQIVTKSSEIQQPHFTIIIYELLSRIETSKGNSDNAMLWLNKAEQLSQKTNMPWRLTGIYYRHGVNKFSLGDYAAAEEYVLKALELNKLWGERRYAIHDKYRLAQIYAVTGRHQMAYQIAKEVFEEFDRLGMTVKRAEIESLLRKLEESEFEK